MFADAKFFNACLFLLSLAMLWLSAGKVGKEYIVSC